MKILLIDNYDSFTYNLYHYISNFKKNVEVVRNDKIDGKTILRKKYNKIVISPGPGNPNQAGNCLKIVKEVYKKNTYSWSLFRSPNHWSGFWWKNN